MKPTQIAPFAKALGQAYPTRLVVLILYIQLIALFINYHAYRFQELVIYLCWIPLFTLPYYLFKKKWIYKTAVTIFFIDGLISLFHWLLLKGPVSASSIFILLNTNFNEASEFLSLKLHFRFLLLLPYFFLFFWALMKTPLVIKGKIYTWTYVIVISLSLLFLENN